MVFYFLLFLCAVCLAFLAHALYALVTYSSNGRDFDCIMVEVTLSTLILFVFVCIMSVPVSSHLDDLMTVRYYKTITQKIEESKDRLGVTLSNAETIEMCTLANTESPMTRYIESQVAYESMLVGEAQRYVAAKKSIEARKLGLMSGIVTVFGDE
jgi:hypothetical protein